MTTEDSNLIKESNLKHQDEGKGERETSTKHCTLTNAIKLHLRTIFNSIIIRSEDPTSKSLSRENFEKWLLNHQKVSSTAVELNHKVDDGYSFDEWLNILLDHGFLEAQKKPGAKDLTKTLSNYYISSSHNTYLSGNQLMSRSKTAAYKNVLHRGCRCIEIDVHNGDSIDIKASEEISTDLIKTSQDKTPEDSQTNMLATKMASLLDRARRKRIKLRTEKRLGDSIVRNKEILSQSQEKQSVTKFSSQSIPSKCQISSTSSTTSSSSSSSSSDDDDDELLFLESQVIPGEPIVMHGWTLTAPVSFRAVCKVIGQESFKSSELPVIVSLEVHVDLEQQETMVNIMKEEWGEMLIQAPIHQCDPEKELPRLDQLKRKILVKVKKCQRQQDRQLPQVDKKNEPNVEAHLISLSKPNDCKEIEEKDPGNDLSGTSIAADKKKTKICENLSRLAVYTHTEHFSCNFTTASAQLPSHIFSIGESDLIDLDKTQRQELFAHNRNYIMRTYPAARRIDSSNPRPILFWRRGIQIVAMNWQKLDQGMMLNEGMFSGEQGWVLKPVGYHSSTTNGGTNDKITNTATATATATATVAAAAAAHSARKDGEPKIRYRDMVDLKISILAGQHIPVPHDTTVKKFRPYVCGELHLCEDDAETRSKPEQSGGNEHRGSSNNHGNGLSNKYKQKTQYLEGDQLDFGKDGYQMTFHIRAHIQEDLSFFRFKIKDSRYLQDDLAAWACIRLDRLESGYRLVRLLDTKSQGCSSFLLVKIEKTYGPSQSPSI